MKYWTRWHDNPNSKDSLCSTVESDVDRGNGCVALPRQASHGLLVHSRLGQGRARVTDWAFQVHDGCGVAHAKVTYGSVRDVKSCKGKFPNHPLFESNNVFGVAGKPTYSCGKVAVMSRVGATHFLMAN